MPINVDIQDIQMSLRDAIAYEFYMDNLSGYMDNWKQENEEEREDIGVAFAKLAVAAFAVADIFCITRDDIVSERSNAILSELIKSNNDTNS